MKGHWREQFNREVENFRRGLLYHARISDWETFKAKAGRMFDYLESIEYSQLERRFFQHFNVILAALVVLTLVFFEIDFTVAPELMRLKNLMILGGLGIGSFELFFYINYRTYVRVRSDNYAERRKRFIRDLEQDFRSYVVETELRNAA